MVIFLYSNKAYEHQVVPCLTSLKSKITDDVKIVFYTIDFDSDIEFPNLYKIRIPLKPEYPTFHFYKAELSLLTMELFRDKYYMFSDTDILYSKRFSFDLMKNDASYPMASYGPHEFPNAWEWHPDFHDSKMVLYDEKKAMEYFGVKERTQRYVWSCLYSFNSDCQDFFEEYMAMCKYQYLLKKRTPVSGCLEYYPMFDEIPFNICLWKRGATKNLGFAFLNTHLSQSVKTVEEMVVLNKNLGNTDIFGQNWEYVDDSSKIIAYHGIKDATIANEALKYLL